MKSATFRLCSPRAALPARKVEGEVSGEGMVGRQSHPTTSFNPNPCLGDEAREFKVRKHRTPSHLTFYVLIPHSSLPLPIAHSPAPSPYISLSSLQ